MSMLKWREKDIRVSILGSEIWFSYPLNVERLMSRAHAVSSCVRPRCFLRNFMLELKYIGRRFLFVDNLNAKNSISFDR